MLSAFCPVTGRPSEIRPFPGQRHARSRRLGGGATLAARRGMRVAYSWCLPRAGVAWPARRGYP